MAFLPQCFSGFESGASASCEVLLAPQALEVELVVESQVLVPVGLDSRRGAPRPAVHRVKSRSWVLGCRAQARICSRGIPLFDRVSSSPWLCQVVGMNG